MCSRRSLGKRISPTGVSARLLHFFASLRIPGFAHSASRNPRIVACTSLNPSGSSLLAALLSHRGAALHVALTDLPYKRINRPPNSTQGIAKGAAAAGQVAVNGTGSVCGPAPPTVALRAVTGADRSVAGECTADMRRQLCESRSFSCRGPVRAFDRGESERSRRPPRMGV